MNDAKTKLKRSNIMKAIKSTNTSIEIRLAKALWHKGYRYRKNDKTIFGTPDISFKKYRIAIFVDGEFFHGYNWSEKKEKLKDNREYWIAKIERNIDRDRQVNEYLMSKGWVVLRFWGFEIKKSLRICLNKVEKEIDEYKKKIYYM